MADRSTYLWANRATTFTEEDPLTLEPDLYYRVSERWIQLLRAFTVVTRDANAQIKEQKSKRTAHIFEEITLSFLFFSCRKELLSYVCVCEASLLPRKSSCETKQGKLTLWLMSTEAPHGVTFSCPHTPTTTTQKSSSVSLALLSVHEDTLYCFTSQNQPSDSFGPLNSLAKVQPTGHPRHWPFQRVSHLNTRDSVITLYFLFMLRLTPSTRQCLLSWWWITRDFIRSVDVYIYLGDAFGLSVKLWFSNDDNGGVCWF